MHKGYNLWYNKYIGEKDMLKNIDKQKVLKLKEAVTYQKGQVVFLILTQNEALSVTLFFDKRRN